MTFAAIRDRQVGAVASCHCALLIALRQSSADRAVPRHNARLLKEPLYGRDPAFEKAGRGNRIWCRQVQCMRPKT